MKCHIVLLSIVHGSAAFAAAALVDEVVHGSETVAAWISSNLCSFSLLYWQHWIYLASLSQVQMIRSQKLIFLPSAIPFQDGIAHSSQFSERLEHCLWLWARYFCNDLQHSTQCAHPISDPYVSLPYLFWPVTDRSDGLHMVNCFSDYVIPYPAQTFRQCVFE